MLRFRETSITKENLYATKKPIKIWDVNANDIIISRLVKTNTNSKYLIGYSDKDIRPLGLIMPKMSGYVKSFNVKDGDKVKSNKLMSFRIDDEKLLQKYKAIWTNIEDLKNIKLNVLLVYDNRYLKTKIGTYDDEVYTNFRSLNKPEDDIECECYFYCFFTCMPKQILPTSIFRQLCF